ncbi:MAG: hypothetical protein ACQESA_03150 [Patescibacteria group bacterium]
MSIVTIINYILLTILFLITIVFLVCKRKAGTKKDSYLKKAADDSDSLAFTEKEEPIEEDLFLQRSTPQKRRTKWRIFFYLIFFVSLVFLIVYWVQDVQKPESLSNLIVSKEQIDEFLNYVDPYEELRRREKRGDIWDLKTVFVGPVYADWDKSIQIPAPAKEEVVKVEVFVFSGRLDVRGSRPGPRFYDPPPDRISVNHQLVGGKGQGLLLELRSVDHPITYVKVWAWKQDFAEYLKY